MPLPKPRDNEDYNAFIKRCMSHDLMNQEYEDREQRFAVCASLWGEKSMKDIKIKRLRTTLQTKDLPDGVPDGTVHAMFSVFNKVDDSHEVVMPSFFIDGQSIALSSWGHQWNNLPVGKGIIRINPDGAVFEGQFFLNTTAGKEHYETIKAMGDLQEWSFGFRVLEARPGQFDGQEVLFLIRGDTYEVSPVLIGDNRETITLGIKSTNTIQQNDHTIEFHEDNKTVEIKDAKVDSIEYKEGRAISSARRNQLADSVTDLRKVADTIEQMLDETSPKKEDDDKANDAQVENTIMLDLLAIERNRSKLLFSDRRN